MKNENDKKTKQNKQKKKKKKKRKFKEKKRTGLNAYRYFLADALEKPLGGIQ